MDQLLEELLQQVEQLFKEKKYQELVLLLKDEVLEQYNDASLYAWKARAHHGLKEMEVSFDYAQKAIGLNSSCALGYLVRGNGWYAKQEYTKALDDYNKAIELDEKTTNAYIGRGNVFKIQKEDSKATDDYNKAIELDYRSAIAYTTRGNLLFDQKEYKQAIKDFNKAIMLDEKSTNALNNRGKSYYYLTEYNEALKDYNKAILLDPTFKEPYYNKAITYLNLDEYEEAINNYQIYIKLTNNAAGYLTQIAVSQIEKLKKKLADAWYNDVDKLINDIKKLLLFDKQCLTHYTSLTGAKEMILKHSPFRLSEGTFLNDTSEGRELLKYLSFDIVKHNTDETIEEYFIERPFIGSFVEDSKHNGLTLWRMYGKEAQAEAKGSSLTIDKEQFIKNLEEKLNPAKNSTDNFPQGNGQFTFYKVAYGNKECFTVPGSSEEIEKQFNLKLKQLKEKLKGSLVEEQKISVAKLLNDIVYLFKSAEYQYEQEVRLVVQGIGFKKEIIKEATPPKVYIELVEVVPVLQKITLGPKVERADEWAAAFNYYIKEQNLQRKEQVEIVISHLPFK